MYRKKTYEKLAEVLFINDINFLLTMREIKMSVNIHMVFPLTLRVYPQSHVPSVPINLISYSPEPVQNLNALH